MPVAEQEPRKQSLCPHVIAITSGKGGVGKSSIAVNLGLSLVKAGERVCILDADTGLANVNILLGLNPEHRLEHVLFGARTIEEVVVEGPLGMKVIPGASGISECVTLHPRQQLRLTRELARIEPDFNYLLIDTAAGVGETTLDFVGAAHSTLLVITPEPTSLTDAFSLVKLMARRRRDMVYHVVVNMCVSANEARQIFHRFSAAVEKYIGLRVRFLGFIQRDESLRSAVTLQSPVALYPDNDPSSRGFVRLAEALQSSLSEDAPPTSFAAYWQRQFRSGSRPQSQPARQLEAPAAGAVKHRRQEPPDAARQPEPQGASTSSGESVPERELSAWEQQWRQLLEAERLPRETLASALVACHEVFWQRYQQPALALPAMVARLADEPERHRELLHAIAAALPQAIATRAPTPSVAPTAALCGAASTTAGPEEPRPAAAADNPEPSPQLPRGDAGGARVHTYDECRFGSQEHLAEMLQRQGARGKSALELILALS